MAVMYPKEINEYLSSGERKVFCGLKENLSDEWTVFYIIHLKWG